MCPLLWVHYNVSDKAVKVVICLSTGAKFRDWPAERYAYVAKWLVKCKNAEIILVGDMKTAGEYGNVFKKIFDSDQNQLANSYPFTVFKGQFLK